MSASKTIEAREKVSTGCVGERIRQGMRGRAEVDPSCGCGGLRDQIEDLMAQVSSLEERLLGEGERRERVEEEAKALREEVAAVEMPLNACCQGLVECRGLVAAMEGEGASMWERDKAQCAKTMWFQLQISQLEGEVSERLRQDSPHFAAGLAVFTFLFNTALLASCCIALLHCIPYRVYPIGAARSLCCATSSISRREFARRWSCTCRRQVPAPVRMRS